MKLLLITFLMVSFLGISVFSILAMGHGNEHFHGGCVASLAEGIPCRGQNADRGFLNFHVNAFKSFSEAVFNSGLSAFLGLMVLMLGFLAVFYSGIFRRGYSYIFMRPLGSFYHNLKDYVLPQNLIDMTAWLSLHEQSPAVYLGAR